MIKLPKAGARVALAQLPSSDYPFDASHVNDPRNTDPQHWRDLSMARRLYRVCANQDVDWSVVPCSKFLQGTRGPTGDTSVNHDHVDAVLVPSPSGSSAVLASQGRWTNTSGGGRSYDTGRITCVIYDLADPALVATSPDYDCVDLYSLVQIETWNTMDWVTYSEYYYAVLRHKRLGCMVRCSLKPVVRNYFSVQHAVAPGLRRPYDVDAILAHFVQMRVPTSWSLGVLTYTDRNWRISDIGETVIMPFYTPPKTQGILARMGLVTSLANDVELRLRERDTLSDISVEIANQANLLDINSLAYLKEAMGYIGELAKAATGKPTKTACSIVDLSTAARSTANPLAVMATATADTVLQGSYGMKLTVSDTAEIIRSIHRELDNQYKWKIARSSGSISADTPYGSMVKEYHVKCYYDHRDSGVVGLLDALWTEDAFLSLENVWDLVPYSFVIDWFLPVGDMLQQYDANTRLAVLPIRAVTRSEKTVLHVKPGIIKQIFGLDGEMTYTSYARTSCGQLPEVYPHFTGFPQNFSSTAEAGSLIVQAATRPRGR